MPILTASLMTEYFSANGSRAQTVFTVLHLKDSGLVEIGRWRSEKVWRSEKIGNKTESPLQIPIPPSVNESVPLESPFGKRTMQIVTILVCPVHVHNVLTMIHVLVGVNARFYGFRTLPL